MLDTRSSHPATPDLETLARLFYRSAAELAIFSERSAASVPAEYAALLAHDGHMTVTVERYHGSPVDVHVLRRQVTPTHYAREITLTRQCDGAVVQYGIMRVNFAYLDQAVRRQIEAEDTPLGRVLINNNVLRSVRLVSLWQVEPGPALARMLQAPAGVATYGRTALIECSRPSGRLVASAADVEPAVELLEIVAPLDDAGG